MRKKITFTGITAIKFSGINSTGTFIEVCKTLVQFSCSVMFNSLQPHGLQHTKLPYKTWTSGKTYHASGFTYKFISVPFRKQVHFQLDSVQFSRSVVSNSATPWTTAHEASLFITNSWSLLRLTSIESVMPSSHLILFCPLLLLPSIFPSIRVFSSESVLRIRWPKYWSFSLSISPLNEYSGLIPFRIDWFYPCSPRDSQESSPTPQFKFINSSALSLLYVPILTSIHDYWKNYSFDYVDFCWQSNVSAF